MDEKICGKRIKQLAIQEEKIVISASRRTDIPAFYMDWFMDRIEQGFFEVANPVSGQKTIVPATPDQVHTIVFWSKNFGPFLQGGYGQELRGRGFHLFFHFTLNSEDPVLEPAIPPLEKRFWQVERLVQEFGPEVISWRFDPICFYQYRDRITQNNLRDFDLIADVMSKLGIRRCITSFMDDYHKIRRRIRHQPGFIFVYPGPGEQVETVLRMEKALFRHSINLYTCCERKLLSFLPSSSRIKPNACIPNDLLQRLFGGRLSMRRDYGQRHQEGCGCRISRDIGSYQSQPCYHRCLYCYANPA